MGTPMQVNIFGGEEEATTHKSGGTLHRPYLDDARKGLLMSLLDRRIDAGPDIRLIGVKLLKNMVEMEQQCMRFDEGRGEFVKADEPALERKGKKVSEDEDESDVSLNDLSEDQMVSMHERLFMHSMHLLRDARTKASTKIDVLDWVAAPLVEGPDIALTPFSFQACAICMGVDPESLREQILRTIAPKLDISFGG